MGVRVSLVSTRWRENAAKACRPLILPPHTKAASDSNLDWKKSTFPPPTITEVHFSSLNSKTGQITSLNFSNHANYLPRAVSKADLVQ